MTDLRAILDRPLDGPEPAALEAKGAPPVSSPTVLRCDRWARRRGLELAESWAADSDLPQTDEAVAADAAESLFAPRPQPADRPEDPERAKWWAQLMATPEYRALHARTCLSPALSALGAVPLARQWLSYDAEQPEQPPAGPGDGQPGDGQPGDDEDPAATVARIRSTRAAAREAAEEVETAAATAAGLGLGEASQLDAATVARYTAAVRGDATLRAIMAAAGRYTSRARTLQRERRDAPRGEITGVELSGDLARLLSSEALAIAGAIPELETLALYRLATRRCLSYRHTRREPVAMGPIVVSVDESGSMAGEPIAAAKGLALAMAWIARQQRRPCLLVGYSGEASVWTADAADPDATVAWCRHFDDGGTVLDGPCGTLPAGYWPAGEVGQHADHIIITDGQVACPDALRDSYRAWAAPRRVRTWGLIVGGAEAGGLAAVADRHWCLPDLSTDHPAVQEVLSIGPTS